MKILLVDAFDSFVYIVYQYLLGLGHEVRVIRTDKIHTLLDKPIEEDLVILGPGPGHPADCGYVELIKRHGNHTPFFGICLGLQAIGLTFGAQIARERPIHGQVHEIQHDGKGCFTGLPQPMKVTRYHSLVVSPEGLPDCFTISAQENGIIMGLRHNSLPIEGVQFHPESIGTEGGMQLLQNLARMVAVG